MVYRGEQRRLCLKIGRKYSTVIKLPEISFWAIFIWTGNACLIRAKHVLVIFEKFCTSNLGLVMSRRKLMQFPLYWFLFRTLIVKLYFTLTLFWGTITLPYCSIFVFLKSEHDHKSRSPSYEKLCQGHKVPQLNIVIKSTDNRG